VIESPTQPTRMALGLGLRASWGLSTSAMSSLLAGLVVGLKNSASFRPLSQMPEPEELRPNPKAGEEPQRHR